MHMKESNSGSERESWKGWGRLGEAEPETNPHCQLFRSSSKYSKHIIFIFVKHRKQTLPLFPPPA